MKDQKYSVGKSDMSILSWLKNHRMRILKITGISLGVLLIGGLVAVNYMAMRIASPSPSVIPSGAAVVLEAPGNYGLRVKSLACLDGKVPTLVVEPDATQPISLKGKLVRTQLIERGANLTSYATIRGTVVILHGRTGRKENGIGIAERFCAVGLRCILIDLPSHGESPVENVKFGSTEWEQDLPFEVLTECAEKFQFSTENVALWGMSMGGSFATAAAADQQHGEVWDSITIVCSLDALTPVIEKQCEFSWLTKLTSSLCQYHGGADFAGVTPAKWATGVSAPVLVVHGDEDELIPEARGMLLHDSFASTDKKWLTVKGGNHDNILITPMPLYAEMAHWILERF